VFTLDAADRSVSSSAERSLANTTGRAAEDGDQRAIAS
jgi:hypothetical protein